MIKILKFKQFESVGISDDTMRLAKQIQSDLSDAEPNSEFTYDLNQYYSDINKLSALRLVVKYDPNAEGPFVRFKSKYNNFKRTDNLRKTREENEYLMVLKRRKLSDIVHEVNHLTDTGPSTSYKILDNIGNNVGDSGIRIFNDIVYICSKPEIKSMLTEVYVNLLLKNTTRSNFMSNLYLDPIYNLMKYTKKVINEDMDELLQSDNGKKYVYYWNEFQSYYEDRGESDLEIKNKKAANVNTWFDRIGFIASEIRKKLRDRFNPADPMATDEQVRKFTKKHKQYCLKNIDIFTKKCGKLFSLFSDTPLKVVDFTDEDYIDLIDNLMDTLGDHFYITKEELNEVIDRLKSGKEFSINMKLKV